MKTRMTLLGLTALAWAAAIAGEAPDARAISPDGKNEIRLWANPLAYAVVREGVTMVARTEIGMVVDGKALNGGVCQATERKLSGSVATPIYKKASVDLTANETLVNFGGNWAVRMIARNDGVAYRFETEFGGKVVVKSEDAGLTIPDPDAPCGVYQTPTNYPGCEESIMKLEAAKSIEGDLVYLPLLCEIGGKTLAVTEADVVDYPIWNFVRGKDAAGAVKLDSRFPNAAKRTINVDGGGPQEKGSERRLRKLKVVERHDYLAVTKGTRTYPYRVFILTDRPSQLCEADIVYALAREPEKGADFSWVRPGKVAWDWWNNFDNKGMDGCTTAGYKRFIDFAAKSGVEYVILDEGWSEHLNIWKFTDVMDVPEIIRYGNEKGVGIILWMAWAQICGEEERVAKHFGKMGAKGFKVDFMDRGDADIETFLEKFAEVCAKEKLIVDYHGVYRPTGLQRRYPNILNYEGIHGLEQMKWYQQTDFMGNDVCAFFGRLTAGPMDYTPGAMDNYQIGAYEGDNRNPGSIGTRCHQMALMALYEAPLQMLCDSPTKYERNPECFAFMAATPVTWDATVGLGGCPKSYAAVARKAKDGSWYAAAINRVKVRDVTLDTSFLGEGEWRAEIFRDAADSAEFPTHYVHERKAVRAGEKLSLHLSAGGGFVIRFVK